MKCRKVLSVTRLISTSLGTFGLATTEFCKVKLQLHTLELPWRKNRQNISCILPGNYDCSRNVQRKIPVWNVRNVPGRSAIQIHPFNHAGDKALGFESESEGCITLGLSFGMVGGQYGIIDSRQALGRMEEAFENEDFVLMIQPQSPHLKDRS